MTRDEVIAALGSLRYSNDEEGQLLVDLMSTFDDLYSEISELEKQLSEW